jgi:regulator of replication initiation timing
MNEVDIKKIITEYVEVDDSIAEINKSIKELRNKKKILEDSIKEYMENNDISKVELDLGSLKISKSTSQKKISKKDILPVLIDNDIDDSKVNDIVAELFDGAETEEKTKVVRSKK